MSLRIQNNIAAMNAHRQLTVSSGALSKSLERLSSGYRINRAADDAAGLSISQAFRADIASYKVASRNTAEAASLLQVAEGATDQIGNMLTRLKELATQAASANSGSNLDKINAEGNKLIEEIDRIAQSTEYAGSKLLDGSFGVSVSSGGTFTAGAGFQGATGLQADTTYTVAVSLGGDDATMTISATIGGESTEETISGVAAPDSGEENEYRFAALGLTVNVNSNLDTAEDLTIVSTEAAAADFQVGAKNDPNNDRIGVLLESATAATLGLSADQLKTAADAQTFMDTVDDAIADLNAVRGDIGAAQNRLTYAAANLATTIENTQAAESVIRDVDMASEMTTFTKNQILMQAGTAMLAQANMAPQQVLSLFQ